MMSATQGTPIRAYSDESYSKVFIVCGEGALSRKCLVCDQVFTRQESFEHSMTVCYPPASTAN